eukprot:6737916-Prymnesium_polylepis.1
MPPASGRKHKAAHSAPPRAQRTDGGVSKRSTQRSKLRKALANTSASPPPTLAISCTATGSS